jgi:predicted MFS family arabinose efflux permease
MLPMIGWMIDNLGWRWPFLAVGLLSLIGSTIVWLRLPPIEKRSQTTPSWAAMRQSCLKFNVLAAIVVSLLVFLTVNIFVSVWGIWLTADFALDGMQLGFVQSSIGFAEITGSISSSLFIDRLGKRLGSGLSLLLTAFFLALLPLTQHNFVAAIATLISIGLMIEFAIVSLIPIYSEQAPEARGTVLALTLLGAAIGGTIGTPIAATLWEQHGLGAVCAVAAVSLCVAVVILWRFLQESPPQSV